MKIKDIFDKIASEPGSNKKMEILEEYKGNDLLKRVLYLSLSPRVKFYIKQIPSYSPDNDAGEKLEWALDGLKNLSNRTFTGHMAINWLSTVLSGISSDDGYIVERIIDKDPRIGMASSNVNKVFKNLIEETPYMGAKSFSEELARKIFENGGQGFSQIKMDGRYCNAVIRKNVADLESRQGEPTIVTGAAFLEELSKFPDCVLNGELTMDGVSRYESNGIISSIIDITSKQEERSHAEHQKKMNAFIKKHGDFNKALNSIRFTVWDIISVEEYENAHSNNKYSLRLRDLEDKLNALKPKMISMVETVPVFNYEEAMNHFQKALAEGHEGTILKSSNGTWKDGKPNWQIKMKLEMDVDLKITGFNYGTGKNAELISSLNAESSDGLVVTSPTGITEKMMKFITENQDKLLGTIIETECSGLSQDRDGNYALLHPRFKKIRDDKNTCDSLESIKEIEAMAKGLITK